MKSKPVIAMLHSHVSPDILNQGWGSLSASTVFVQQTSSVSSLASWLVSQSSIRKDTGEVQETPQKHRSGCLNSDFLYGLPKDTYRQVSSPVAAPAASPEGQDSTVDFFWSHPPVLYRQFSNPWTPQIVLWSDVYTLESFPRCLPDSLLFFQVQKNTWSLYPPVQFLATLGLIQALKAFQDRDDREQISQVSCFPKPSRQLIVFLQQSVPL